MGSDHHQIQLAHGGGGQLTAELIRDVILPALGEPVSAQDVDALQDAAILALPTDPAARAIKSNSAGRAKSSVPGRGPDGPAARLAFTTDSYVVQPLEFPGADIGKLSVCGTVNDLAVSGAVPQFISLALVLEEGLDIALLQRLMQSAGAAARAAGVKVVTGDTKVVERGGVAGMIVNTSGVGRMLPGAQLGFDRIRTGDAILLTGPLGEHGLAVMSQRKGLSFRTQLQSDCAALNGLTKDLLDALGPDVHFMRDPTRGGLAAAAADIAASSGFDLELREAWMPLNRAARSAAEILGLDLVSIANEGKLVAVVARDAADKALAALRKHAIAAESAVIGYVMAACDEPMVEMVTAIGGRRIVQMPYGEELPRIC